MNKLKRFLIKKILPTLLCFVIISQEIAINALPAYADDTDIGSYSQSSDMSNPESDSNTDSGKKTEKNDSSSKKDDSSSADEISSDNNQIETEKKDDLSSVEDSNEDDNQTDADENEDEDSSKKDDSDNSNKDDDQTDAEENDYVDEDDDIIDFDVTPSLSDFAADPNNTDDFNRKINEIQNRVTKMMNTITPGGFIVRVLDELENILLEDKTLDDEGRAYIEWLKGTIKDAANMGCPLPQNIAAGVLNATNDLINGIKQIKGGKVFDGVTKTVEGVGGTLTAIPFPPAQAVGLVIKGICRGTKAVKESINKRGCLTGDVLITMADGTLKKVKDIEPGDMVLTWNFYNGEAEPQPVVFNDILETKMYAVVNVTFDDGTEVEIVGEHGFFDLDAGEYVYFNTEAGKYVGHSFAKLSDDGKCKSVKLIKVDVTDEIIEIYSPVSAKNFCIYANGMLSMPGDVYGFFNYFDVDTDDMKYNKEKMTADIEKYGEYTYADFSDILSEEMYDAFDLKYMKVSVGKGLISWEDIENKIEKYNEYLK